MGNNSGASAPDSSRDEEISKYRVVYRSPAYKMGKLRKSAACRDLAELDSGSLLDVGCGRGEVLDIAEGMGFSVQGVEVVPDLIQPPRVVFGQAHALPFPSESFDHVTMYDVMEHLLPGDDAAAVAELMRVARKTVTLTIADFSHMVEGVELHINRRRYADWDSLLRMWAKGHRVEWLERDSISETWRICVT